MHRERAGTSTQAAITGSGTANFLPVFRGSHAIGNSQLFQQASASPSGWVNLLGIGTTSPNGTLHVNVGPNMNAFSLGDSGKSILIRDTAPGTIDIQTFGADLHINCCQGPNILMLTQPDNTPPLGMVSIGESNPQNILTVKQGAPTAPIADAWTTYSSRRWKTDIRSLDGALDKVQHLRAVYFNWTGTGKHDLGLVAEEVAQVIPELVAFEQNGKDAKSVDYGRLTAVLVEAIREQQSEIAQLKIQVRKLKSHLNNVR